MRYTPIYNILLLNLYFCCYSKILSAIPLEINREGAMHYLLILMALFVLPLGGCVSAQAHRQAVNDDSADRMTVGTVQREIRVGMTGADVASVLGSPNVVTTDEERREVWIYDKISTERAYSSSSGGLSTLILGGAPIGVGAAGGGVGGGYSQAAGASSTSQRTLTVIIKFDNAGKVRDFAYHTSRF